MSGQSRGRRSLLRRAAPHKPEAPGSALSVIPPDVTFGKAPADVAATRTPVELLLHRAKLDSVAALLTLLAAAMCLGLTVMYFGAVGQTLVLPPDKMGRWMSSALPAGAAVMFVVGLLRGTPWFAGIMSAMLAWMLPLPSLARLLLFLVLCVAFGAFETWVRQERMIRLSGGRRA